MPRYNVKVELDDQTYYFHFSSVIEAPLCKFMLLDDYKKWYIDRYNEDDWNKFMAGKCNRMTFDEAVEAYNLSRDEKITKEQFIERFKNYAE